MKRRWTFDPGPFIAVWLFGGLIAFITVSAFTWPCDSNGCGMNSNAPMPWTAALAIGLWLGPFALAITGLAVWWAVVSCWNARPRRVVEPITTDLREAEPPQPVRPSPMHDQSWP